MSYTFRKTEGATNNSNSFYFDFDWNTGTGYYKLYGGVSDFEVYLNFSDNTSSNYLLVKSTFINPDNPSMPPTESNYCRGTNISGTGLVYKAAQNFNLNHFKLNFYLISVSSNHTDFIVENDSSSLNISKTVSDRYNIYLESDNLDESVLLISNCSKPKSIIVKNCSMNTMASDVLTVSNSLNLTSPLFSFNSNKEVNSSVYRWFGTSISSSDMYYKSTNKVSSNNNILSFTSSITCPCDYLVMMYTDLQTTINLGENFSYSYKVTGTNINVSSLSYSDNIGNTWVGRTSPTYTSSAITKFKVVCPQMTGIPAKDKISGNTGFTITPNSAFDTLIGSFDAETGTASQSSVGGEWTYNSATIPTKFKVTCTNATEKGVRENVKISPFSFTNQVGISYSPKIFSITKAYNCAISNNTVDFTSYDSSKGTPNISVDCTRKVGSNTVYQNTLCRYFYHKIKENGKLYFCPIILKRKTQSVKIYPIGVYRSNTARYVLYDLTNIKDKGVDTSTDFDNTGFNTDKFSSGIQQLESIIIELNKDNTYTLSPITSLISNYSSVNLINPSYRTDEDIKVFSLLIDGRRALNYSISKDEYYKLNSDDTKTIDSRLTLSNPDNFNEIDLGFVAPTKHEEGGQSTETVEYYDYEDMFHSDKISPSWIRSGYVLPTFNEVNCTAIDKYKSQIEFLLVHEDDTYLVCSGVIDDDFQTSNNIKIKDNYIQSFSNNLTKGIHVSNKWGRTENKFFTRDEGKIKAYGVRDSYINNGKLLSSSINKLLCTVDEDGKLCLLV